MKNELQKKLVEKYPKIFLLTQENNISPVAMFGIECDDGWFSIINVLCRQIQGHIDWRNSQRESLFKNNPYNIKIPDEVPQVTVVQIKEKFGTLRFYTHGGDERIDGMIRMAEAMSAVTCETCGNLGQTRGDRWFYTSCEEHIR